MKNILLYTGLVFLLTACYEDKGSYVYHTDKLNEIKSVSFTPTAFETPGAFTIELQQPLTEKKTERIKVKLEQTLSDNTDNLDFLWRREYRNEGKKIEDTVYTKGYIDVELPPGKETQYKYLLRITDRTTTLSKYVSLTVKTRPIFKNSLFVLHGNNTGAMKLGNIEVIGNDAVVRMDAYNILFPNSNNNPFQNSVGLGYTAYGTNGVAEALCVFNIDGTARVYNPYGLIPKFHTGYVLPGKQESFIYNRVIATGNSSTFTDFKCLLSKDGKFYTARGFPCFHEPAGIADTKSDYQITAATITEQHYLLWDAKYERFLYVSKNEDYGWKDSDARNAKMKNLIYDANIDFSSLPESLNPTGKEAVYAYIQYREKYAEAHPFFLFKDKDGQQFYLYELTPVQQEKKSLELRGDGKDDDKDKKDNEPAYTITGKKLKNFRPGDNLSTILYNTWFTTNFIFYTDGANVYRYNTSGGDHITLYSAPADYKISVMKFKTEDTSNFMDDLGRYLVIGMNKNAEGAIAEIKLTTSADLDTTVPEVFYDQDAQGNKFGNIRDLQFAYMYLYKLPSAEK